MALGLGELALHSYLNEPISAEVAKKIVASMEFELFGLQPEYRDLETLFREVSSVQAAPLNSRKKLSELNIAA